VKRRSVHAPEILKKLSEHNISRIKLGVTDIDGVLRGKYVSIDKFTSAISSGLGFCDVIFGWDIADVLYDNAKVTGWHTGYPDAGARIDLDTFRVIPWEPGTAFFLMDLFTKDGAPIILSPRQLFRSVLERAAAAGFSVMMSAEYEFWIFAEKCPLPAPEELP
jgi:glutamine synthetase